MHKNFKAVIYKISALAVIAEYIIFRLPMIVNLNFVANRKRNIKNSEPIL